LREFVTRFVVTEGDGGATTGDVVIEVGAITGAIFLGDEAAFVSGRGVIDVFDDVTAQGGDDVE